MHDGQTRRPSSLCGAVLLSAALATLPHAARAQPTSQNGFYLRIGRGAQASLPTSKTWQYWLGPSGKSIEGGTAISLTAWIGAPGGGSFAPMPKNTYLSFDFMTSSGWTPTGNQLGTQQAYAEITDACPHLKNRYGSNIDPTNVVPFDTTWRATLRRTGSGTVLQSSNTVRTVCAFRGARFVSGTWDAVTVVSGKTYPARWVVTVSGDQITGQSYWDCCPGPRTDPLTGTVNGDRVVIVRRFAGQGAPPGSQTHAGSLVAPGRVVGTMSGSFVRPGSTFTLTLRR